MNLKILIALIVVINGKEDPEKTTYWKNKQDCMWVAQEISRDEKLFKGVEFAFCRPEWVDKDVEHMTLKILPLPTLDEEEVN